MKRKKRNPGAGRQTGDTSKRTCKNSTPAKQRRVILSYLLSGNHLSTLYAREFLGIMHPGGRVLELRDEGHDIRTHWTTERDTSGKDHRVAAYVLMHSSGDGYA